MKKNAIMMLSGLVLLLYPFIWLLNGGLWRKARIYQIEKWLGNRFFFVKVYD